MHKLLERQIKRLQRRSPDGELNVEQLLAMISETYDEADIERHRMARSMQLVSEELIELNSRIRQESEAYIAKVLAEVRDGVLTCSEDGVIHSFNVAMEEIFRVAADQVLGGNIKQLLPGLGSDFKRFFEDNFSDALSSEPVEMMATLRGNDRVAVDVSVSESQLDRHPLYIVIFRDITKKKQAEEELVKAKEAAIVLASQKANFLSTMSHEIRTPMNAVVGITNLLLMDQPRDDQIDRLNTLKFSSENLLALINDVLDFNKIEAGRVELEHEPFQLRQLLDNLYSTVNINLKSKGLQVVKVFDERLPDVVIGDQMRLSQILGNLCSNAGKFTESGTITLSVSVQKDTRDYCHLLFSVADTGIGIEASRIHSIFDDFTQANASITRKYGGTGLGLAICQRLLQLSGSDIGVKSVPGEGSTFYFELKFKKSDAKAELNPESGSADLRMFNGERILLVEDNKVNQMVATQFLTRWGLLVDVAENGRQATEMVVARDYNLVLMDLQMPVMDGYTATRIIRSMEDEKYGNLPIIALTASVEAARKITDSELGINDVLSKPFQPLDLNHKIASQMQK